MSLNFFWSLEIFLSFLLLHFSSFQDVIVVQPWSCMLVNSWFSSPFLKYYTGFIPCCFIICVTQFPRVFWRTEMTARPRQYRGRGNAHNWFKIFDEYCRLNWRKRKRKAELGHKAEEVRFETVVLVCMAAGLKCRSQVTGQITGQVTGHTHKKLDTGENCSGLTFYYTKIK